MEKYRIGYTTGVFDMFHIGHLNVLKKAKEMSDILIVGISTDELVLNYKGRRPIIPFEDRLSIVESVRYVDKVVPQTTLNKLEAWRELKFDALFHGSDWADTELYRNMIEQFKPLGVDVVFFPYTEGISSSELRKKGCQIDSNM